MRLVRAPGELADAVAAAQREAAAAFGSDEVFLERYLDAPRHVEVQVIGDTHGTVLHLLDRECSVQRRHQKVVEEAPAVLVPVATRREMWDAAVAVARAVGYVGAGTVEYLVDDERLLLPGDEHAPPGRARRDRAGDRARPRGPAAGGGRRTAPSLRPGRSGGARPRRGGPPVRRAAPRGLPADARHGDPRALAEGPGLRTDRAIESGSTVSPAYDSLVAKFMAHGQDRASAIGRLSRALRALELDGLETNRQLLGAVLDDTVFRHGEADVHYLDTRPDLRDAALRRRGTAAARRRRGLPAERRARRRQPRPGARGRLAQRRPAPARRRAHGCHRDDGGARSAHPGNWRGPWWTASGARWARRSPRARWSI